MMIPKGAAHPVDAMRFMDFVFDPKIAALITAYVNYVTPVPAAQQELLDMAEGEDPATATQLQTVAEGPLVFPDPEGARELQDVP